ncbi:UNVERIFIED_ORG: aspartate aminotransferase [Microbispora rosea subsp. rosea]
MSAAANPASSQVTDLLTPLDTYMRLHAATLRRFGTRAVDLSFPNPRFLADPHPYQTLAKLAARCDPLDLRYSPFGGFTPVRRRIAAALSKRHQLPYCWSDIIMTPGAAAALTIALRTLLAPGEHVMLITPCWMDYPLYLADLGLGCDPVPAAADKHLDLAAIEAAWRPHIRALIITQPVSPTGVVHNGDELASLAALLTRLSQRHSHPILLIADEAHRDQVWADTCCPAPASHYPHTLTVHSFGKAWQMPGQRTGYLAVSPHLTTPPQAAHRLIQAMRTSGHGAPTALMQHLAAALADARPDLNALARLQRHARQDLRKHGIDVLEAHATQFLYARCPTGDDGAFVTALANRGVLTMPSHLFHEPGWFRLALNVDIPDLSQAARIIAEEAARA